MDDNAKDLHIRLHKPLATTQKFGHFWRTGWRVIVLATRYQEKSLTEEDPGF